MPSPCIRSQVRFPQSPNTPRKHPLVPALAQLQWLPTALPAHHFPQRIQNGFLSVKSDLISPLLRALRQRLPAALGIKPSVSDQPGPARPLLFLTRSFALAWHTVLFLDQGLCPGRSFPGFPGAASPCQSVSVEMPTPQRHAPRPHHSPVPGAFLPARVPSIPLPALSTLHENQSPALFTMLCPVPITELPGI